MLLKNNPKHILKNAFTVNNTHLIQINFFYLEDLSKTSDLRQSKEQPTLAKKEGVKWVTVVLACNPRRFLLATILENSSLESFPSRFSSKRAKTRRIWSRSRSMPLTILAVFLNFSGV